VANTGIREGDGAGERGGDPDGAAPGPLYRDRLASVTNQTG
jgi:hypothetical protein